MFASKPPTCTGRTLDLSRKDSDIRYLRHLGNSDIAIFFTVRKCLDDLEYEPHEGWSEDPEDRARLAELRVSPKPWREAADDLVVREIMRQTRRAKENGKVDAFWQTLSLMLAAQEPVSPATLEAVGSVDRRLGAGTQLVRQLLRAATTGCRRRPHDSVRIRYSGVCTGA